MKDKLTLKYVRAELAAIDMTIRKTPYGEYLVRIKGSPKGEGYYTTDLDDALATGIDMWKRNNEITRQNFMAAQYDLLVN